MNAAISLFGFESGAALATVVGVAVICFLAPVARKLATRFVGTP